MYASAYTYNEHICMHSMHTHIHTTIYNDYDSVPPPPKMKIIPFTLRSTPPKMIL